MEALTTALTSFRPGSAEGPSGLRPRHLQELSMATEEAGPIILAQLDRFAGMLLRGEFPVEVVGG